MADDGKDFVQTITAEPSAFIDAMKRVETSAKESAKKVEDAWKQVMVPVTALQNAWKGLFAVVAGGKALEKVIEETRDWGAETGKISKQLQITTAEATAYQVACRSLGIDSGAVVDASDKMARQLQKNESAFKTLGVETRNANGSWRSTGELLPDVMDKLRGIGNVTQQNIAGQQIFGKSWNEMRSLLKLGGEALQEARTKARDLNLEVDPAAVRKYQAGLGELKLIGTSLAIQAGNVLLPVLTDLGKWFGEIGPYFIAGFNLALKATQTVVMMVYGMIKGVITALAGLAAVLVDIVQGKFAQAWEKAKLIPSEAADANRKLWDQAASLWTDKPPSKNIEKSDGGQFIDFEKEKKAKENILALWEAQLEERKLKLQEAAQAEGRFAEMSKTDERAYWQAKLSLTQSGSTEQISVRKKIAALGLGILKEEYDAELASLRARAEAFRHDLDSRRVLIEQEAALVAQKHGEQSKEYQEVQAKLTALAREGAAQRQQIEQIGSDRARALALAKVDADQADMQIELDLQRVTQQQFLDAERGFEARRYEIKLAALRQQQELNRLSDDKDPVKKAQIDAEIEALETLHQQRMTEIQKRAAIENNRYAVSTRDALASGFQSVFMQIGKSVKSLGDLLRGLFQVVVQTVVQMLARIAATWLANQIMQRVGGAVTALGEIEAQAAVAGAAGTASMSGAPWPLNMSAPAFGAAMSAMAASYAAALSIPSASMGWEVPRDMLAFVHRDEKILPASIAVPMREQVQAGNVASGGAPVHIHGAPDDTVKLRDLADLLRKMGRNFEWFKR